LTHNALPALFLLLGLLGGSGLIMTLQGNHAGWLLILITGTFLPASFFLERDAQSLLYLPPVLISVLLGLVFAHTLLPGNTPLITSFARFSRAEPLDSVTLTYTRKVTLVWSALFCLLAVESTLLAIFASYPLWSLFTNFLNYLIILLVFALEYRVRIRRLSHLSHPGFIGFLLSLRKFDIRTLRKS
jgi:uncharacterized membrane protein